MEPAAAPAPVATAEPEAPSVLVADAEGVTKLTADAPVAEVLIDTIGYDRLGNVDIAGRGVAGGLVQLYIDNALAGTDMERTSATPQGARRIPGSCRQDRAF